MAKMKRSFFDRTFRQMDMAFWCMHEHLPPLAILALPTIIGTSLLAAAIAVVFRTWQLPAILNVFLYGFLYPIIVLIIITLGPVPCAVFAYHRSAGRVATVSECYRHCLDRAGRLASIALRLVLCYCFWFLLFGIPMLVLWPRTSIAPLVALFENDRRVLVRARKLLKEENAVYLLALLYTLLTISLGVLIFVPRLLLLAEITQGPWTYQIRRHLWLVETISATLLVAGMAVSWCLSLTFLYGDIRRIREGSELRERIRVSREKLAGATAV